MQLVHDGEDGEDSKGGGGVEGGSRLPSMAAAGLPGCRPVVLGSVQLNLCNVLFEDGWQASAWH